MVAPRYPQITTYNTTDYYQVIREADRGPGGNNPNGENARRPDGGVSREELSAYSGRLQREQRFYQFFGQFFENFLGYNPFEQRLQDVNKKLDITGIMQNNFGSFDADMPLGGGPFPSPTPDGQGPTFKDGRITYREVYDTANKDGDPSKVTLFDVFGYTPYGNDGIGLLFNEKTGP